MGVAGGFDRFRGVRLLRAKKIVGVEGCFYFKSLVGEPKSGRWLYWGGGGGGGCDACSGFALLCGCTGLRAVDGTGELASSRAK